MTSCHVKLRHCKRVIVELHDREAGVQFVITTLISDHNRATQSELKQNINLLSTNGDYVCHSRVSETRVMPLKIVSIPRGNSMTCQFAVWLANNYCRSWKVSSQISSPWFQFTSDCGGSKAPLRKIYTWLIHMWNLNTSHVKFSLLYEIHFTYVKSTCVIGTLHMWRLIHMWKDFIYEIS